MSDVVILKKLIPYEVLGVFITDNDEVERASEGVLEDGLEQFRELVKDLERHAAVDIFLKGCDHQNMNELLSKCFQVT